MNAQLNYIIARHRSAELQRAGLQACLAHQARRKAPGDGRRPTPIMSASVQPAKKSPRQHDVAVIDC